MRAAHVAVLVGLGVAGAYLFVRARKVKPVARVAVMPGGSTFVGPPAPVTTGVVGSKPGASFVGPLPFVGPPAPVEFPTVDTSWLETPQSAPM